MIKKLFIKYWFLLLVFLIALVLRTYQLSDIPLGLHGDEASIGYNAYSLLKTAHDQNGNFLPLAINQFGDFRPAGYHYLDIPFVAFLGLTELAVRLPSALFGAFSVIAFYFLLLELFDRRRIANLGALLLTISPWHIIISRATSEGVIAAFFVIVGITLVVKGIKVKKRIILLLILGFVMFEVSFLFYHSARFFVPVFVLFLLVFSLIHWKASRKKIVYSVVLMGALLLSLLFLFTTGKGSDRPLNISILNIPGGTTELKQSQDEDGIQNPLITRFNHNKLFFYGRLFAISYAQHFDGEFLFVNTGLPVRYKVPWSGNVYPIEAPFILFGLAVLLSEGIKTRKFVYLIPVAWLFIGPIPAGLTWEDIPNIQRSSMMLYALLMITSFGLDQFLLLFKKKWSIVVVTLFALFLLQNSLYFFHNYFYHSKIHEPWNRSAAERELIFAVDALTPKFKTIVMTTERNNNLIFYLFYKKFDPQRFQDMGSPQEKDKLRFLNMIYRQPACPLEGDPYEYAKLDYSNTDTVFIDKSDCKLPKNAEILQVIKTPDGSPAFFVVKLNKPPLEE